MDHERVQSALTEEEYVALLERSPWLVFEWLAELTRQSPRFVIAPDRLARLMANFPRLSDIRVQMHDRAPLHVDGTLRHPGLTPTIDPAWVAHMTEVNEWAILHVVVRDADDLPDPRWRDALRRAWDDERGELVFVDGDLERQARDYQVRVREDWGDS